MQRFSSNSGKLLVVTYYSQNSKFKKNFTVKFSLIFKDFDCEITNFQEQKDFPPRDFDKRLQIVSCTATERHRMKKFQFHRL